MRSLTARLAERDARLARLAKRNPKTHDDYRNALAKVRYLRGEASETCLRPLRCPCRRMATHLSRPA